MAASWYCGSDKYAAVPTWQANHVYAAGAFVRQTAPTDANARVFRTAAGGTSHLTTEPTWSVTKGSNTTDNTITWTEVTGNSAYGWSAAGSRIKNMDPTTGWMADGDTLYLSKNHSYTVAGNYTFFDGSTLTAESKIIVVDPAGSVPPVAADVSTGATESVTGANTLSYDGCFYMYGVNLASGGSIQGTGSTAGALHWEQGNVWLNNATAGSRISPNYVASGDFGQTTIWDNVTCKFGAVGQAISMGAYTFKWRGGGVDSGGSAPTNLFKTNDGPAFILLAGLDLSSLAGNQIFATASGPTLCQMVNCKLGSGYTVLASTSAYGGISAEMIISDSGTANYKHERHDYGGDQTTELTNVLSGGANDGTRPFSWKIVTTAKATYGHPWRSFPRTVRNDDVGVSKTLTVEFMLSTTALKKNEFVVRVEYLGSSASPQATHVASANVLDTANCTTSTATWDTSGVSSPVTQKVTVVFTPQMAGDIRWWIEVGKASTTVYSDLGTVANT